MTQLFFKATSFRSNVAQHMLNDVQALIDYEADALAHWIFDKSSNSTLIDMDGYNALSLQSGATIQPVFSAQGVEISTKIGNALLSDIYSEVGQSLTMSVVCKMSSVVSGAANPVMLMGCLPTTGVGPAVWFQTSGTTPGMNFGLRNSPATNIFNIPNFMPVAGQYLFVSMSIDETAKKVTGYVRSLGLNGHADKVHTLTSARSSNPIALGSSHYGNEGIVQTTFAEAMIHPRALTLTEMQDLASRAALRCAKRGVIF